MSSNEPQVDTQAHPWLSRRETAWGMFEVVLIAMLYFLYAGSAPPDVNEAHYLCKAKNFWQPDWCRRDFFLASADAHWVFYWTVGWLTKYFSLATTAWIGRWLTWIGLAIAWWRLGRSLFPRRWVALLTAGIALVLWDQCHMAGEWVVGGVEAKGIAYVLVIWALAQVVRGRWSMVFILLGIASAFHVLVGGWTVLAALGALAMDRRNVVGWRGVSAGLVVGGLASLPGLIPALQLSMNASTLEQWRASEVYVFYRLGHHLLPQRMEPLLIARFVVLCGVWLALWCWLRPTGGMRRLQDLCAAALLFACVGVGLALVLHANRPVAAMWLRYYWFRQSDALVPLALALLWGWGLVRWHDSGRQRGWFRFSVTASVLLPMIFLGVEVTGHVRDPRPNGAIQGSRFPAGSGQRAQDRYADWLDLCAHIRHTTPADALLLAPYHQQTLKWYAERAELVTWKDVPQDAVGVVEWWERSKAVRATRIYRRNWRMKPDKLLELLEIYNVQYVIVDREILELPAPLRMIYRNNTFRLFSFSEFELPPAPQLVE
jgi:hypothetical protein